MPRLARPAAFFLALILGAAAAEARAGDVEPESRAFSALSAAMSTTRTDHTATLLQNGQVLLAGGDTGSGPTDTAELFDPTTGLFTALSGAQSKLSVPRKNHTATVLPNGKVLLVGGDTGTGTVTNTADLYDPATRTFSALPSALSSQRAAHTATLLASGKVLIAGGRVDFAGSYATAELFDPAGADGGTFTLLANGMARNRADHTATLLDSGKVLLVGGWHFFSLSGNVYHSNAEIFDPAGGGSFTLLASTMSVRRYNHTATLLPLAPCVPTCGQQKVLIAGGTFTGDIFNPGGSYNTAEVFDPAGAGGGTFSTVGDTLAVPRARHSATLLPSGKVLLAGGSGDNTADLYDPAATGASIFTAAGSTLSAARASHTATLLSTGSVLLAGGGSNSADLFDAFVVVNLDTTLNNTMSTDRARHTATTLRGGGVLIAGGVDDNFVVLNSAVAIPDDGSYRPSATATLMSERRQGHTATLLPSGKVLLAGGWNGVYSATAELYDPASSSFAPVQGPGGQASLMSVARADHAATLLPSGKVLITGGNTSVGASSNIDLFDPASGSFAPLAGPAGPAVLARTRHHHSATLLPSGKVLVVGGGGAGSATGEVIDPLTGSVTLLSDPLEFQRLDHTATLLPTGRVLIAGGTSFALAGFEIFDPATATFTTLSVSPSRAISGHTATLLPSGKVLLVGGSGGVNVDLFDPSRGALASYTFTPSVFNCCSDDDHTATLMGNGVVLVVGGEDGSDRLPYIRPLTLQGSGGVGGFVQTITDPLVQPGTLTVAGSQFNSGRFRGISEGSSGDSRSSPTDFPLLQLSRLDNEQTLFAPPDPTQSWTSNTFKSAPLGCLPAGPYRATILVNGTAGTQKVIDVQSEAATTITAPSCVTVNVAGNVASVADAGPAAAYVWTISNGTITSGQGTSSITFTATATGTVRLSVSVTAPNNCGSGSIEVTSSPAPTATVSGSTQVCKTCTGGTASVTGGGPFQWGYRTSTGGAITNIPGATSASYVIQGADFPQGGRFFLVASVGGSCTGVSNEIAVDVLPQISIADVRADEGNSGTTPLALAATLDVASFEPVTVAFATADNSATLAGNDYQAASGTLTFAPGTTSRTVTVQAVGDTAAESNESFFVNLSTPTSATILDGQGRGTIVNDDGPRVLIGDVSAVEGNSGTSSAVFPLTLIAGTQSVQVTYSTANGTAVAPGDYTAQSFQSVTLTPAAPNGQIVVSVVGDTTAEADETFKVLLAFVTNATAVREEAVGTILNDDGAHLPFVSVTGTSVTEGAASTTTPANFTVQMNESPGAQAVVSYATADGTAQAGQGDYLAASGSLTFAAGTTSLTRTVPVTVLGDAAVELDETFTFTLTGATGATIVSGQATGTILDDDTPPATISIGDRTQAEGDSGTADAAFTVALSRSVNQQVTVAYATANGTASAPGDYTSRTGTLTFPSGTTSLQVLVPVVGDTAAEGDETFFVNLSSPTNATLGDGVGQGTITNDDFDLAIGDATVTEGNSGTTSASFTVTLTPSAPGQVTVAFATADGTAVAGSDYTSSSGVLTFAAGTTTRTVPVSVSGDTLNEANETFFVNLTSPTGGGKLADGQGLGTITNDDPPPSLSIGDRSQAEGNTGTTTASFTVTLSAASGQQVTVSYATANNTATAGSDYVAASGSLTFAAGVTSATVPVTINGDTTFESDETYFVNLSSPSNATLADGQGLGTIVNDDAAGPTVTPGASSASPGQVVSFTVANGPGAAGDWLALAATSAANSTYLDWKYLNGLQTQPGSGLTSATVSFAMPGTPGSYEVRFFANNGFTRLATSASVTVVGPSVTPSTTSATTGQAVTANVANGPGNAGDWLALALTSAGNTTYVDWRYLNGLQSQPGSGLSAAAVSFTMPSTAGSYEFRFFQNNGFTRLATSAAITVATNPNPVLDVQPTSLGFGNTTVNGTRDLTVTVKNVGGGTLSGSGSITGGSGRFSLVGSASYALASNASQALTVRFSPNALSGFTGTLTLSGGAGASVPLSGTGVNGPSITPSASSVNTGAVVGATVANGPANTTDWIALAATSAGEGSYLAWSYLNGSSTPPGTGLTGATVNFTMPATPGTYEFRFYSSNSFTRLATSSAVTVLGPSVTPSTTSATAGQSVTATVANGPANAGDWLALALTSAGNTTYVDWRYLNGLQTQPGSGLSGASVPFTMPSTAGSYEFRFFQNNGFTRLATSAAITVASNPNPVLDVQPASLGFGGVAVNGTRDLTVTVKNAGGGTLSGSGSLSGSTRFTLIGDASYALGSNATKVITVRFSPDAATSFTGTLTLSGGSGAAVPLSGTGTTGPAVAAGSATANVGGTVSALVSNGPGSTTDWIALSVAGSSGTAYVDWRYLNGQQSPPGTGLTSATVPFVMPSAGSYEFRLLASNGFTRLATSGTITVSTATPTITASSGSVVPGGTVNAIVANGPGSPTDWIAVALVGSGNTAYVDWKYLNGQQSPPGSGLSSATVSFAMPTTPGSYEFRLYSSNGFTRLATSTAVTVGP